MARNCHTFFCSVAVRPGIPVKTYQEQNMLQNRLFGFSEVICHFNGKAFAKTFFCATL